MNTNSFGLSRYIPSDIKRKIRENSGFGCVICGMGVTTYEHVEPEFHKAKIHDPNKMTLLCYSCHGKVTTGMWSKKKVKIAMRRPKALKQGFSNDFFDVGDCAPIIKFAGSTITECPIPVMIKGTAILKIEAPEESGGNFLLSGYFRNSYGTESFFIRKNEWFSNSTNWDLKIQGKTLTIKDSSGEISLKITSDPSQNMLTINKIKMSLDGWKIHGDESEFTIENSRGGSVTYRRTLTSNCRVGFNLG